MAGRDIRAGRAFVEIFTKDSATKGLRAIAAKFKAFGASIGAIGAGMLGAATVAAGPLAASVKTFADWGSELHDASQRTGISAQALAELGHAAEQSGASFGALEKGVKIMQRTLFDAARGVIKEASDTLGLLGMSAKDLEGLSPEEQFTKLADALSRIEDPGHRAAMAMRIFGRGGVELLPMLADGAAGIATMRQEFSDLGGVISNEASANADTLGDKLGGLWLQVKIGAFAIGEALAPSLIDLVSGVLRAGKAVITFIQTNQDMVTTVAKVVAIVAAVGAGLVVAGGAIAAIGFAISGFLGLLAAAGTVFSAIVAAVTFLVSPLGIMIALAVALAGVLLKVSGAWDLILGKLKSLKETALEAFAGIKDALAAGDFKLAAQILWLGLKLEFTKGIQPLMKIWTVLKNRIFSIFDELTTGLKNLWLDFLDFIGAEHDGNQLRNASDLRVRERDRDLANAQAIVDGQQDVANAQAAFDAARAEAKRQASDFGADGPRTEPETRLPDNDQVARSIGTGNSKGAFLASAAALLGRAAESIEQKQLDAIEEGNDLQAKIERNVVQTFA